MDLVINVLEAIGVSMFLKKSLTKKYEKASIIIFSSTLSVLLISDFFNLNDYISVLSVIINIVICKKLFVNNLLEISFICLFLETLILSFDIMSALFFMFIGIDFHVMPHFLLLIIIICKISFLIFVELLTKEIPYTPLTNYNKSYIFFFMILILIYIGSSYYLKGYFSYVVNLKENNFILGIFSIIIILMYMFFLKLQSDLHNGLIFVLKEKQEEQYKLLYEKNKKIYDENRKLRHDIANLMKYAIYTSEIGKLKDKINSNSSKEIVTSNSALDFLINSRISSYPHIKWEIFISSDLKAINEFDLIQILGNTLDNAIENLGSDNKIMISTKKVQNNYIIVLKNSISHPILMNNNDFVTSKKNSKNHGVGLKSVSDIVKKNNGFIHFTYDNDVFIANIILPIM